MYSYYFLQTTPSGESHLPSHDYEGLSKLQEEATYEVVDQPHPLLLQTTSSQPVQLMCPLTSTQRTNRHYNNTCVSLLFMNISIIMRFIFSAFLIIRNAEKMNLIIIKCGLVSNTVKDS